MADTTCEQPLVELKAGMLTMGLEPETAFLRYVRFGEHEVVRGIYGAVRDRNWGTVPSRISDLKLEQAKDSFRVTGCVDCISGEIDYRWSLEIVGQSVIDGRRGFDDVVGRPDSEPEELGPSLLVGGLGETAPGNE